MIRRSWMLLGVLLLAGGAAADEQGSSAPARAPKTEPKDYAVSVAAPEAVPVGSESEITVTITPKAPWRLKVETPFSAVVRASEAVVLAKSKIGVKDILNPKSDAKSFKIAFTPQIQGEHTLASDLSFFLCTSEMCKREKHTIKAQVLAQ